MRTVSLLLVILLLSGCTTMQVKEGSFIRPDAKPNGETEQGLDVAALLPGTRVTEEALATPDGATLRGILVRKQGANKVVLYFGGNAFHLDQDGKKVLPLLAGCGTNVALFDYRGYGRSSGTPSVATLKADALRLFDQVNARFPGEVVVHGQSLGSFVAAYVAQQRPATRGLVLEATASTAQDWANAQMPWYAKSFVTVEVDALLREVDNLATVAGYSGPSLVLSGENDSVTPPFLGRKVFDAIPSASKRWLMVKGAGHNDILSHDDVAPMYCALVKGQI